MEPKKIALLVGAVVVALVTALMARSMIMKSSAPAAAAAQVQANGPKVLVATRALPVGTILDDASFRYQPWPKELVEGAYYVEGSSNPNTLRGAVVRTAMSAGTPMTMGSVVQPGDRGFLAAALAPGMRAITVTVSVANGVAGFVFPGDRVDVMLTQTVDGQGSGAALKTSETIVRNLRVLATDQRTVPEDEKGNKTVVQFGTVTLEVTPRIGEKIAVAQTIGQLILSLRPIADDAAELERAIASGAVNLPAGTDPKTEKKILMQIASSPSDSDTTFVTGADVSRFQRRSMPSAPPSGRSTGFTTSAAPSAPATMMVPATSTAPAAPRGPTVIVANGTSMTAVTLGGSK